MVSLRVQHVLLETSIVVIRGTMAVGKKDGNDDSKNLNMIVIYWMSYSRPSEEAKTNRSLRSYP